MSWVITPSFSFDPDAAAYIAAVEAADTQALETATRYAINDFVIGCKQDGIWNAIKASCILAGARTLTGALVPLVGAAPTNVSDLFVSGDYNRETGLVGNGSTKYLDSNRNNNVDPQNSKHVSVFLSTDQTSGVATYAGSGNSSGDSLLRSNLSNKSRSFSANNSALSSITINTLSGFLGVSRSESASVSIQANKSTIVASQASASPTNRNIWIFAQSSGTAFYTSARLAFYSIGESLDLALLDARVTDLINAFAAAIP
jgi:hypothetical protein